MLGLLGSLGVSIVGNFQETSVMVAHFVGASLSFGLGTVYLWIQVLVLLKYDLHLLDTPARFC